MVSRKNARLWCVRRIAASISPVICKWRRYARECLRQTAHAQAALAATNTLGYRIGMIVSGAGALYLAEYQGWTQAYVVMALLMALPASEAFGPAGNPQFGVGPQDTMVFYLEIEEANEPLAMAEGEQVEPEDGLPTVEADGESAAQIDVEGVDDPEELVVQPLIEGERKEVRPGQLVRVHYTGVTLSDGEQFDTSYERGEPFEFQVGAGRVIPGWEEGLIGQTVGSRVLLVIPAAQAYGEAPEGADDASATATANPQAHPLEGEDLVFVVDILGAY